MSKGIVTDYPEICFICGRPSEAEHHLVFGTAGREDVYKRQNLRTYCKHRAVERLPYFVRRKNHEFSSWKRKN